MESQMTRDHVHGHGNDHDRPHHNDQNPHHVGHHHEEEVHHEHQSVMQKVKAKAKKIKDGITKHGQVQGHGHDHDHDHDQDYNRDDVPDDHDLDEEEDDDKDEEIIQDPEVHGAPMHKSTAISSDVAGQGYSSGHHPEDLTARTVDPRAPTVKPESHIPGHRYAGTGQPGLSPGVKRSSDEVPQDPQGYSSGLHHEDLTARTVDPRTPTVKPESNIAGHHYAGTRQPELSPGVTKSSDEVPQDHASNFRRGKETDPTKTFVPGQEEYSGQQKVNIQRPMGLGVEPDDPGRHTSSNYQTKVTDPTERGDQEADVSGLLTSLEKMDLHSASNPRAEHGKKNRSSETEDILTSVPTGSHDQFAPELTPPQRVTAGRETHNSAQHRQDQPHDVKAAGDRTTDQKQSSYAEKISFATAAIADKAMSAKNVVASKLGYGEAAEEEKTGQEGLRHRRQARAGENENQNTGGDTDTAPSATSVISDKATPAKNVIASKLGYGQKKEQNMGGEELHHHDQTRAGENQKQSGSYTEKISSATSALASKFGYGDKGHPSGTHETHVGEGVENKPAGSTADYGKKVTSTVAEKLAPVYGTVSGAGRAVTSRIPGTKSESKGNEKQSSTGGAQEKDKGVTMKEYFVEKLSPGEEDKALSEMISGALHIRKKEPESKPVGKVTESMEVRRRLEPSKIEDDSSKAGSEGSSFIDSSKGNVSGDSVVDKIKGTVGSWFTQGSQPSPGSSTNDTGVEEVANKTGERTLQQSGN